MLLFIMYIYPYRDTFKTFATDFRRRLGQILLWNCNKQYIGS